MKAYGMMKFKNLDEYSDFLGTYSTFPSGFEIISVNNVYLQIVVTYCYDEII